MESNKFIHHFRQARVESSGAAILEHQTRDSRYCEVRKEIESLFNSIEERLGNDRATILHLEELQNEQFSISEDWVYQQAFFDCVYMLKWMGVFRLTD